jgi:flagellar biosynthesis protein FlhA
VRQRLGQAICQSLLGESAAALQVITLDPAIESRFLQGLHAMQTAAATPAGQAGKQNNIDNGGAAGGMPDAAGSLLLEPTLVEQFSLRLAQLAEAMMKNNLLPVLLCSPQLRRQLRALSERAMPHLRVLSMAEVPGSIELKSFGVLRL